jgi:hypothetical protein
VSMGGTTNAAIVAMLSSTLGSRASKALVERLVTSVETAPPTPEGLAEGCRRVLTAVRMFVGETEAHSLAVRLAAMGVKTDSEPN